MTAPLNPHDASSPRVPLLADVPATHPLSRHVVGRLPAAGFAVHPTDHAARGLDLGAEVYDAQP